MGNDQSSNNSSGFGALPGGYRNDGGPFYGIGSHDDWWSSTESSTGSAWDYDLCANNGWVSRYAADKRYGFAVRCLRDF